MASASVMQPVALAAAPVEAPAAAAAAAAPAQAGEKESAPPAAPTSRAVKVSTPQIHWHGKSPVFAIDFHPHNRNLSAPASSLPTPHPHPHCPRLPLCLSLLFSPLPIPFSLPRPAFACESVCSGCGAPTWTAAPFAPPLPVPENSRAQVCPARA